MSLWAAYEAEMADYFDMLKEEEGKLGDPYTLNNFGQRMYLCKCGRMKLAFSKCECEIEEQTDKYSML